MNMRLVFIMTLQVLRGTVAGAVIALLLAGFDAQPVAAQDSEETFTLSIVAMLCDELPNLGTLQGAGCVPAVGASFEVTTEAGDLIDSCVAEPLDGAVTAFCRVEVPYGSTVVTTLDESTIPEGYALYSANPQTTEIPSVRNGEFPGPVFIALLQAEDGNGDANDGSDGVETLPGTGVGAAASGASGDTLASAGVLLVLIGGTAVALRRRLVG
jgi:hypothetical protein